MKVAITGAGGFVGSTLVRLMEGGARIGGQLVCQSLLVDRQPIENADRRFSCLHGELGSPSTLREIAAFRPDVLFHLASMPGGAAEADYEGGRSANMDATLGLFEAVAATPRDPGVPATRVVFASTIAVYGTALPEVVGPATPLHPPLTYGAHKLIGEILLADFTRRGVLDGRSLRLPGIVARPRAPSGLASAFMSELLHALRAGEPFTCPVSADATAWWMSARRCAENLLHAAGMTVPSQDLSRAWPMPVLRLSLQQVVDALASLYGDERRQLVRYEPQAGIEAVFGRYPTLDDVSSRALGLCDDGNAKDMILRALNPDSDNEAAA